MINCPWCGTNYESFHSNCQNCGGPMQIPSGNSSQSLEPRSPLLNMVIPPAPPRPISNRYVWRLLVSDGWAIAACVFGLLGFIFILVGVGLTLGVVTAFMGIPFSGLGLLLLGGGGTLAGLRYQAAKKTVGVLRVGEVAEGQIAQVVDNFHLRVNGHYPWVIRYEFRVDGQLYEGWVSTLNTPGAALQPGQRACVLFLPQAPGQNVLYPHP